MPIFRRCSKCKMQKDEKTIGQIGVCTDCMELAIVDATEPSAVVEQTVIDPADVVDVTGDRKLINISKDSETHGFDTNKEAGDFLGVHFNSVASAISKGKEINGWVFT